MSSRVVERRRLLRSLLELERPVERIVRELSALPWECDHDLLVVRPHHLIEVLGRLTRGSLTAEQVESWADAIEGREDVGFEEATGQVVKAALFDLANPQMQGELTAEVADRWLARLRAASEAHGTNGE